MTTSWERFRARWLRNKSSTSFDNPKLDAFVAAAFFCDARDVKTIAQTSRTAQRAAKRITKRIRADVTRGCARQPVPVVGGAGFPRGFRYASRVVAPPGYDDFRERPRGDVHAPVAVAWLAAHGCWGLVAAADLEADTRVCDYAGALVSLPAAPRRTTPPRAADVRAREEDARGRADEEERRAVAAPGAALAAPRPPPRASGLLDLARAPAARAARAAKGATAATAARGATAARARGAASRGAASGAAVDRGSMSAKGDRRSVASTSAQLRT
ncbi:hypothetical protein JL720_8805 [Aureococcus anophagefferens]|nr:hypothetical protein JL720_8805 [Aureococcus anophagefferens]